MLVDRRSAQSSRFESTPKRMRSRDSVKLLSHFLSAERAY
jgi:hypothetical protein